MTSATDSPRVESFEQFMESLREPGVDAGMLSPSRFCEALHIDLSALAEQARVHPNTVKFAPQSESVQRFLREVLRVLKAATELSGDLNKAQFWYRNYPLQPFRYKTAEQVVADGKTDDVVRYISMLEAGASG